MNATVYMLFNVTFMVQFIQFDAFFFIRGVVDISKLGTLMHGIIDNIFSRDITLM